MGHDENHNGYLLHSGHDGGLGDACGILRQYRFSGLDLRTLGRGCRREQHVLPYDGERRHDLTDADGVWDEPGGWTRFRLPVFFLFNSPRIVIVMSSP